jgi:lysophospholipase L1-like esterase
MPSSRLRISVLAVTVAVVMAGPATAAWAEDNREASKHRPYLALGDSVVFGFITQAGFEYGNPDNFVGYPDYVARSLRLAPTDASCPGEATGGFLSPTGADNGCRRFRQVAPLHVAYGATQLLFAEGFLDAHPHTRLVTIGLGANDVFLLQHQCANNPQCISAGLPDTLATIARNMETILFALRTTGFRGVLMVVNYYSLDYSDLAATGGTQLLNQAITAFAQANGAVVADVFTAFQAAASTAFAGGQTCKAGLLNASPQNQFLCDVHPSQSGQKLIGQTIADTFRAALAELDEDD